MIKKFKTAVSVLLSLLVLLLPVTGALATEIGAADVAANANFTVIPILPENQRDTGNRYFDLSVTPSLAQTLVVGVYNTGAEDLNVRVDIVTPYLNENGIMEYSPELTAAREAKPYDFASYATLKQNQYTITPGQAAPVEIDLAIPADPFTGEVLGAVLITKMLPNEVDGTAAPATEGIVIQNQYRYAIAIRLAEGE